MADKLKEAQERYQDALDASRDQRIQIEEDLRFSDPSEPDQWDAKEKADRENDKGGRRPCLVHDQTSQYTANVSGQVEKNPPSLHALPVDGGSDKRVAEQLDGYFRYLEYASRAQQHYTRALTSAARAGVGYLVIRPTVVDAALNYQEPRISSEGDPLRVVLDPWSVELDGSDADCGWLLTKMGHRAFELRWGKEAEKVSFGDEATTTQADARESIVVAEQWIIENDTRTLAVYLDEGSEATMPAEDFAKARERGEQLQFVREYKEKYRCVKWSMLSGAEELVKETIYPSSYIGIVPMYGYVGFSGGRMRYCGIPRRAREPQRAYNWHVSEIRAIQGLAAKAPYLIPMSGLKGAGLQDLWDRASVETRAYLPYEDWDADNGRAVTPPTRAQVSVNLSNHEAGALQALKDIQAAIGLYQANLGAPSNETSGVAIESRKQQGEATTANFPSHMAASIGQVGRICLEMTQKLVDTKRQLRILGHDMAPSAVQVNPEQSQSVQDLPQGGISINPNVGKYDVHVVVGPSFSTQRSQTNIALNEVMTKNPALAPVIAPMWAKSLDLPDSDKLSQALSAMAPEPVKAIYSPQDQQESPAALKAQLEQMQGKLQEAAAIAKEAQDEALQAHQELDAAKGDTAAKVADSKAKGEEVDVKAYEAKTKRLDVLVKALGPQAGAIAALGTLPKEMPPDLRQLLVETVHAASMQPNPDDDLGEVMPETPEEPAGPSEELQALEQVTQGQQALMQAMGQLIKLVQAKRIRTPEYRNGNPDERVARVVDEIDPEALAQMQPEGPMQ